jgi:GH15 family glucan-1,4-alpha-glucosidase
MPSAISDYAMIGDCETAALVARDGSIDWLCWPRFDSDACFAALLGGAEHGRWQIAPAHAGSHKAASPPVVRRRYLPDTLILETRFETGSGAVTITDFMPPRRHAAQIVRIVEGESGSVPMCMELTLRFGYGTVVPWVTRQQDGSIRAVAGPDMVSLHTPVPVHGENLRTVAEFSVSAGERIPFSLTYSPSHLPPPRIMAADEALALTQSTWTQWSSRWQPTGPWADAINRSLITLKALTYGPTGGIVAAPTTSLPEHIGGVRNWDYRYCWLRDATLTLLALMDAGHYEEARAWREWLLRAVAGRPDQTQIMYGIAGERRLDEWEVHWLPGYRKSKPVRVGNAAHSQLQIDVYGEVMDAFHVARRGGLSASGSGWALQLAMLEHLERFWSLPDEGLWEIRGTRRHFTYSKAMAWVAFDRAIKSAKQFGLEGPIDRWAGLCLEIHADVCRHGFDHALGSFVQSYGSKELDASLLLLPVVGFLPVSDPRVSGTIAAIERRLMVDGFLLRYDTASTPDGLPPGEGAFLACSFWLVDAYVLQGRFSEANALFARLVDCCNDVGLLSEEYDPAGRRLVGNFPQAFSHLALINSAFNLTRVTKPAEQRAEPEQPAVRTTQESSAGRRRAAP